MSEAGKTFWRSCLAVYDLSPAEVVLLRRAVRTIDVLEQIDAALADDGVSVEGSVGQLRAHPLLALKCENERVLDALIRGMCLPFAHEDQGKRRTRVAAAAAAERWRDHG